MARYNAIRRAIASRRATAVAKAGARICRFYLDCFDNARHWDFAGNGEHLLLHTVLQRSKGDVLDVGGHIGEYAVMTARLDPNRAVYCFEPVPQFAAKAAIACEAFPNIRVHDFGLSNVAEMQRIFVNKRHPRASGTLRFVHEFDATASFEAVECRFRPGADVLQENGLTRISLLKVDVEGMEARVLDGFQAKLAPETIEVVQFEHGPEHAETGHTVRTFQRFFDQRGFEVFMLFPNCLRRPEKTGADSETFRGRNLVAIGKPHVPRYSSVIAGAA